MERIARDADEPGLRVRHARPGRNLFRCVHVHLSLDVDRRVRPEPRLVAVDHDVAAEAEGRIDLHKDARDRRLGRAPVAVRRTAQTDALDAHVVAGDEEERIRLGLVVGEE
jgi:hypothetical protein